MRESIYAPASVRNAEPIFAVLADELRGCRSVLEIGTGTAHHAVTFASRLPRLVWQTSDVDERCPAIRETVEAAGLQNLPPPLPVDVRTAGCGTRSFDAVYSSNTAHIMNLSAVRKMLRLVGELLAENGVFCYYGPFKRGGQFSTRSNASFDASLKSQDPEMGIRDLEEFERLGADAGLQRQRLFAMPANNLLLVSARNGAAA